MSDVDFVATINDSVMSSDGIIWEFYKGGRVTTSDNPIEEVKPEYPNPAIKYYYTFTVGQNGVLYEREFYHSKKELFDYLKSLSVNKRHQYKIGVEVY